MVRGTVVLPHGTGKSRTVLVVAEGPAQKEAEDAGADFVLSADDAVAKIQEGWLEFDAVVATPDMMRTLSKVGRVLGPRGLMPNPKSGTVTQNVADAVNEIKAGRVEFRVDRTAIVHAPVGKVSFGSDQLAENTRALINAVLKAKPTSAKGKYVHTVYVCSTMGPGVQVDLGSLDMK
jgi:large subunit ribosomal protein L1